MGSNYNKIVIGLDGSEAAEKAFKKSIEIAKRDDAKLILVYVVDSRTFTTTEAYDKSLSEKEGKYAKNLLDEYQQNAKESGITDTKTIIKYGSPKVVIPKDIVPEENADLIIVGATGLNAVERFLIGSVSESIVRYSNCDVLIIR